MTPEFQQVAQLLALLVLALGLVLAMLPIGECEDCQHCRDLRLERRARMMDPFCPLHLKPRSKCEDQHRDK